MKNSIFILPSAEQGNGLITTWVVFGALALISVLAYVYAFWSEPKRSREEKWSDMKWLSVLLPFAYIMIAGIVGFILARIGCIYFGYELSDRIVWIISPMLLFVPVWIKAIRDSDIDFNETMRKSHKSRMLHDLYYRNLHSPYRPEEKKATS